MSMHNDVTAPGKVRILIVDDHEAIRSALIALLSEEPDLAVMATAENAEQALDVLQRHPIDLAIIDISLGATSGLELTQWLLRQHTHLCVIILSMHDVSIYGARARQAGACAYVSKQTAPEELVPTIRRALAARAAS